MLRPHVVRYALLFITLAGCNLVKGPPRDHECRARLRTIIGLETAFYSQHQRYSVHPAEIGFVPSQGNRYLYIFDKEGPLTRRDELASPPHTESVGYGPDTRARGVLLEDLLTKLPDDVRLSLGVEGACPDCNVTVACVGNIDDDPAVDVWSISTKDRPGAVQGTPLHHVNDTTATTMPPKATVQDDCTLATPLMAGVPGSPGHLIPSDINPNGASELATLMRTFVADWKAARVAIEEGKKPGAKFATHRKLRCAWPTDANDRNAAYDALAVGYLDAVKRFDAAPSRETYNGVLGRCRACHEVTCGGPLEVIDGLVWK